MFQSLFLWIFRSYLLCLPQWLFQGPFQSLFLWIFRSYEKMATFRKIHTEFVSILVLMDLPFLQKYITEIVAEQVQLFQSLFLWIFRSYVPGRCQHKRKLPGFQSLFLWIFRSYWEHMLQDRRHDVSILVLMDLPFLQITIIYTQL